MIIQNLFNTSFKLSITIVSGKGNFVVEVFI